MNGKDDVHEIIESKYFMTGLSRKKDSILRGRRWMTKKIIDLSMLDNITGLWKSPMASPRKDF